MQRRDETLDVAKGLMILSVIYGHLDTGFLSQVIYIFHMPFFFMLSGYFHRVEPRQGKLFKKKSLSLLLPYFAYLLLFKLPTWSSAVWAVMSQPSGDAFLGMLRTLGKLLYGGEVLTGEVGVFWFITCLFLTQQLYNVLRLRIRSTQGMMAVAAGFYGVALIDEALNLSWPSPWAVSVVAMAFLFYTVGATYGRALFASEGRSPDRRWLLSGALALSALAVGLQQSGISLSLDMKHVSYGVVLLSPLCAIALTLVTMTAVRLLTGGSLATGPAMVPMAGLRRGLTASLAYLGTGSMTLMYVHRFVQYRLPAGFASSPWIKLMVITTICTAVHALLCRTKVTRALWLGDRQALSALLNQTPAPSAAN